LFGHIGGINSTSQQVTGEGVSQILGFPVPEPGSLENSPPLSIPEISSMKALEHMPLWTWVETRFPKVNKDLAHHTA
jgi:hypothetical protein